MSTKSLIHFRAERVESLGKIEPVVMLEYARNTNHLLLNEKDPYFKANRAMNWKVANFITG